MSAAAKPSAEVRSSRPSRWPQRRAKLGSGDQRGHRSDHVDGLRVELVDDHTQAGERGTGSLHQLPSRRRLTPLLRPIIDQQHTVSRVESALHAEPMPAAPVVDSGVGGVFHSRQEPTLSADGVIAPPPHVGRPQPRVHARQENNDGRITKLAHWPARRVRPVGTTDPADDPFGDPRLVGLYDQDNPGGSDHEYFRALADERRTRAIVDLGCGTGLLTVSMARRGRTVLGIDPSETMIGYARSRAGADRVTWRMGDSRAIGEVRADLVIMSGNVAQHILGEHWHRTLRDVRDALRPDGTVAFESRNPAARAWEEWTEEDTRGTRATAVGPLTEWLEVTRVWDGEVTVVGHNIFESTGEHLELTDTLAFRSQDQIADDLRQSGLIVDAVWGDWHRAPVQPASRVFVFEARRPAT